MPSRNTNAVDIAGSPGRTVNFSMQPGRYVQQTQPAGRYADTSIVRLLLLKTFSNLPITSFTGVRMTPFSQ